MSLGEITLWHFARIRQQAVHHWQDGAVHLDPAGKAPAARQPDTVSGGTLVQAPEPGAGSATAPAPMVPYQRGAFLEMLISSILGLIASLVLSIDAIELAKDPLADLSCNLSSTISCGKVGVTWQANLLGFPNAFLGLIAEPVVITVAVAALGGSRFRRGFMLSAQAVYSIGLAFAYWLFYEAYFVIHALCPWCLMITVTTTLVFTSMTRVNILEGNFGPKVKAKLEKPLRLGADTAGAVLLLGVLAAMVVYRYL